jgi:hypothetical protein
MRESSSFSYIVICTRITASQFRQQSIPLFTAKRARPLQWKQSPHSPIPFLTTNDCQPDIRAFQTPDAAKRSARFQNAHLLPSSSKSCAGLRFAPASTTPASGPPITLIAKSSCRSFLPVLNATGQSVRLYLLSGETGLPLYAKSIQDPLIRLASSICSLRRVVSQGLIEHVGDIAEMHNTLKTRIIRRQKWREECLVQVVQVDMR